MTTHKTVLVVSDISGHLDELDKKLQTFGIHMFDNEVPNDVVVILNGDVVHRGPKSAELLEVVDKMVQEHPENIIPIVGNHELLYLDRGVNQFRWNETVPNGHKVLNEWWESGVMRPGVGVTSTEGDYLVTHAGLTRPFWNLLGASVKLNKVVTSLDEMAENADLQLWNAGEMLGHTSRCPGPVWASSTELLSSWNTDEKMPDFHQVSGHAVPYNWWKKEWYLPEQLRGNVALFPKIRHSYTVINGRLFVCNDPNHGRKASWFWEPFVIHDARLVKSPQVAHKLPPHYYL